MKKIIMAVLIFALGIFAVPGIAEDFSIQTAERMEQLLQDLSSVTGYEFTYEETKAYSDREEAWNEYTIIGNDGTVDYEFSFTGHYDGDSFTPIIYSWEFPVNESDFESSDAVGIVFHTYMNELQSSGCFDPKKEPETADAYMELFNSYFTNYISGDDPEEINIRKNGHMICMHYDGYTISIINYCES